MNYLLGLLLILAPVSQVYCGLEADLDAKIREVEAYLSEDHTHVGEQMKSAGQTIKRILKEETRQRQKELEAEYETALVQLRSAPEQCTTGMEEAQLTVLKAGAVTDFLHCPKLILGLKDVGNIIVDSVDLVWTLVKTVDDFIGGFAQCNTSWLPWKFIPCYIKKFYNIFEDIKASYRVVKDYANNVEALAHNISEVIHFCKNSSLATHQISTVMTPVHQCARLPIHIN